MPFTPDSELELAFPAELIPAELNEKLDQNNLHVRALFSHSDPSPGIE